MCLLSLKNSVIYTYMRQKYTKPFFYHNRLIKLCNEILNVNKIWQKDYDAKCESPAKLKNYQLCH